ncbi:MAG TPA: threonine ammonia-lyase [Gaiellaceae bacterium]|nr:threonine ammonia-lyase [Gaiellaceae bacterium]
MATETVPTLAEIREARERLHGIARETPVFVSETFSRMVGRDVQLKAEALQRTGAFKIRGAYNKVAMLGEAEREAGVVAASAGNHGQAVAWAAREAEIKATVYMPLDAPMAKVEATVNYGANVELTGEGFDEALATAIERAEERGATFVHAFEDERVIAGQGTIGLEIAEQLPDLETLVVPIGGGGLASGIALALREVNPRVRVVGVQAAACAPYTGATDHGFTIADGIAVKKPSELTGSILRETLEDIVTVTDDEIGEAMVLLLERAKLVVEGAGAASLAAVLAERVGGKGQVAALLSGGNIDPTLLISVMRRGLTSSGRYLVVRTKISDRPGELLKLLSLVAEERVNVISVEHHREGLDLPVVETEVELTLATRDRDHRDTLLDTMRAWGYAVERVR